MLMSVFLKVGQPHETRKKMYSWTDAAEEMNEEVARRGSATGEKARRVYTRQMVLSRWTLLQKASDRVLEKEGFDLVESEKGYVNSGEGSPEGRKAKTIRQIKPKEVASKEAKSKKVKSKEVETDPWEGLIDPQL